MSKIYRLYLTLPVVLLLLLASIPAQAQELDWQPFDDALAIADTSSLPVLVDVWAPWCGWCSKMREEVYPALGKRLSERFVLTRLNHDDHETTFRYQGQKLTSFRLAQKLRVQAVPSIVLLTPDGEYLLHLTGYRDADTLNSILDTLEPAMITNNY